MQDRTEMKPWFPLPSNLVNKGEQWIPQLQINATVSLLSEIVTQKSDNDFYFLLEIRFTRNL